MARIFITGSSDGLGLLAAQQLIQDGHQVFAHARISARAKDVEPKLKGVKAILTADLSSTSDTIQLANSLNELGKMDAIIHNAGVYTNSGELMFQVNVLAPYILTALIEMPSRLVYISSNMHTGGKPFQYGVGLNTISYSDSKLHVTTLMKVVADRNPNVFVNAVDPGWVPTKMGGANAPDDLQKGYYTQVWLSVSQDQGAQVSGKCFHHKKQLPYHQAVNNSAFQRQLIDACESFTNVHL